MMAKKGFVSVLRDKFTIIRLNEAVKSIVRDAKSNARWSSAIPHSISLLETKRVNNELVAIIVVDLSEAPMARAFEFGSGVHVNNNPEQTYRIEAKTKLLKFPFSLTYMPSSKFVGMKGKNIGQLNRILRREGHANGTTYWNYVDHPGVKARPYIRPAIEKNRDKITSGLLHGFMSDISLAVQESWNG